MKIFDIAKKYQLTCDDIKHPLKVNQSDKCLARLWDKGDYGNTQCQNIKSNGCLCSKHYNSSLRMGGLWWLGLINEERPENPIHPISGLHKWSKDKNGNDYIIEKKHEDEEKNVKKVEVKEKRKRGRPKGSKNKIK